MTGIIRAVLFDFFGTLILYPKTGRGEQLVQQARACGLRFSDGQVGDAFAKVTIEVGQRKLHDGDFLREAGGHTKVFYMWYYERLLELLGFTTGLDRLAQKMFEEYVLIPGYSLDPQALPLLRALRNSAFRVGGVSNGPRQVRQVLARYQLDRLLQTIVISDEVGVEKPNPAIFQQAMRNLEVNPAECIYLGDVPEADMVGARNAGMRGVLIDRQGKYPNPGVPCTRIRELKDLYGILGL